jgi:tRNA threonylcarbamoyladenosine biosynthesis protein TsaE
MQFTVSHDGLNEFAQLFWNSFPDATIFAFHGEMGAGKTTLITALCHGKGVTEVIGSPTFSIINEYAFNKNKSIYHMDLYRLNSIEEIIRAGVEDCLESGSICMVEWPEKAAELFDERAVNVFIKPLSESERLIDIPSITANIFK